MSDGFYIGPIYIYYYGVIIMVGALAALWLAIKEAKYRKLDPEIVWDVVPWLLIVGIVGARLWHVLTPSKSMGAGIEYYFSNPIEILKIRKGGLGIPGAILGGILALAIYCRKKKLNFFTWADVIVPGLALAQAIGRWGNFINQELYGAPTDLPWAIHIDEANRFPEYAQYSTYHPLFFYESLWNLLNMYLLIVLARQYKEKLIPGDLLFTYLIVYPFGRFMLEFLRLDTSTIGGININQITMLVVMIFAIVVLIIRHRKPQEVTQEQPVNEGQVESEEEKD
ncbi:MAG TPA: prolipoprotein diacylglyceryl transferase [Anaerolineaceae bacterium]|jgi:phosphatidylglycerol:prolipoprotein diacylglycerol transferase|nr:prolipoprotein diacylglyceryl transferase [Anaerolineaceae bacterium]